MKCYMFLNLLIYIQPYEEKKKKKKRMRMRILHLDPIKKFLFLFFRDEISTYNVNS